MDLGLSSPVPEPIALGYSPQSAPGPWAAGSVMGQNVVGNSPLISKSWANETLLQPVHEFDIVVVVDFEATCDEGASSKISQQTQEIIEFPWVVIDLKGPEGAVILDMQQRYVRPTVNKQLTSFCEGLTGIKQADVDKASPLEVVLSEFQRYLTHFSSQRKTYALLTDGEWDIKVMLQGEALRKGIQLPDYFRRFFDLRNIFSKFRGMQRLNLKRMLTASKLEFKGKHHCGIDDAKNISYIALKLIEDGYRFRKGDLSRFEATYDPSKDPSIVDYNGSRGAPSSLFQHPDRIVRIRGLPWKATVQDVERFFTPLPLAQSTNPIQLTKDTLGRPSGCGYVEFGNKEAAQWAIKTCHKRYLMNRYIEVFPLTEKPEKSQSCEQKKENTKSSGETDTSDQTSNNQQNTSIQGKHVGGLEKKRRNFEELAKIAACNGLGKENVDKKSNARNANTGKETMDKKATSSMVRLRGLPWTATQDDIIKFFEPLSLAKHPRAVHLMKNKRGRPSGLAVVEFANVSEAKQAAKEYHKKYMGKRYIEVHPMSC